MKTAWNTTNFPTADIKKQESKQELKGDETMQELIAVYVRSTKDTPYADDIISARKPVETRTRDMLRAFVGQRVLIVKTEANKKPMVIGSVFVADKAFRNADQLDYIRDLTMIPKGSQYDCPKNGGKWCYFLKNPVSFAPVPLDSFRIIKRTRTFAVISK